VPGSTFSQTTKIEARNTPMANSGTEAAMVANTVMPRSSSEPSRIPATTPRNIDNGTMMRKLIAARKAVFCSRSKMMSLTGTLKRCE